MTVLRVLGNGSSAGDARCVEERAFQYGDGLFETIAVVSATPCLWSYHWDRLCLGCRRLGLPLPPRELIEREVNALCRGVDRGVLKLYWTAGRSERGYRRPATLQPERVLVLHDWPAARENAGWVVRTCAHRLGDNPVLAGIKHLNRLDQVIARSEWDDPLVQEGIMCSQDGAVICGTMSNLVVERNGRLSTPELDRAGVGGVVRRLLLDLAAERDQPVTVRMHGPEDLKAADALYLTNALVGVARVASWEDCDFDQARPEHPLMVAVRGRCHRPERSWGLAS